MNGQNKNGKSIYMRILLYLAAVIAFLSVFVMGYMFGQSALRGRKEAMPGFVYDPETTYAKVRD